MTCRDPQESGPRPHSRRGSLPGPRVSRSQRERRLHKPGTSYIADISYRYHTLYLSYVDTADRYYRYSIYRIRYLSINPPDV